MRIGLGATGYLGKSLDQEHLTGLGVNFGAYYTPESPSNILFGLDVGIAEGKMGVPLQSNKSFNLGYFHPSVVLRFNSGWIHPRIGIGAGPAFFDSRPVPSSTLHLGLDFDVSRSFAIQIEPLRLNWFHPNTFAWTPHLGMSSSF